MANSMVIVTPTLSHAVWAPMTSLTHHVAPQGATSPTPLPSSSHVEDDKENLIVPCTPTSSSISAASSSRRPHSVVHPQQHRKTSSLSSPATQVQQHTATSKTHSRSLSLRDTQLLGSLTLQESALLKPPTGGEVKRQNVMVATPPENLPPSPPLTNHGTDGDADDDSEVPPTTESQMEKQEEDITEAWREDMAKTRQSRELTREHPLGEGSSGDARVEVELEKGHRPSMSQDRALPSPEMGTVAVSRPFEIVRPPRRTASPKPPHSSYYLGPPTGQTAYATPPCGQMGVHHPREIIRIERDYDHGELVQFSSSYPLELQDRITPTQFLETINALNEGLIRAHSLSSAFIDNTMAVLTLWLSPLFIESRYDKEMKRLQQLVDALNAELYNPQGLNILWPRKCAFLFVSLIPKNNLILC